MKTTKIQLGDTVLKQPDREVNGTLVEIDGEMFYCIENYDLMPDFFMTIVSDSNHWMFISSNGSLSAGRKDRDHAIFPYYTDDKIHDYYDLTGSKTIIMVQRGGYTLLWQPFSKELATVYRLERKLFKSIYGNKIIFRERNLDLETEFQYGWFTSDKFGFVKKSGLVNLGTEPVSVSILDGLRNILPAGGDYSFQNEYSNLLDGYKKSELIEETRLGLFMLSSIPVDKAEPSEALNATTVWSYGLDDCRILISDKQIGSFIAGSPLQTETDIRASRGAYFINAEISLPGQMAKEWVFVGEVEQSTADVANLNHILLSEKNPLVTIFSDIRKGTEKLVSYVAYADGLQKSNDELCSARHFSNVLFNLMRGGVFVHNYLLPLDDLRRFIKGANKDLVHEAEVMLAERDGEISVQDLHQLAKQSNNPDLIRICDEYLPLTFSRRHGDPSRPWNRFSIDNKNADGSPRYDFQGNWRDIFQNWEALSISFPGFVENIISKFVNATTADGYNPYRIMRDGIDWESPDPEDPWAYIGYWGDHQIIYLQKLLELSDRFHPGKIEQMLAEEVYVYANVPYRIKPYAEIVRDPKNTILFNAELNKRIVERVAEKGSDGRLLCNSEQTVYHVNLTEKILVLILAKLVNFIPEAGIWLNTQRPEWNDANNALVGNGASMVTLFYLRRFLSFWRMIFEQSGFTSAAVSREVKELLGNVFSHFSANAYLLEKGFTDRDRRSFTDALGEAGTTYRESIYSSSYSGDKTGIETDHLIQFLKLSIKYIDQSISMNRRPDGLYHSYNLVTFESNAIKIRHLYEMLEGQVAVLSSGYLSSSESLEVLSALKQSALFRADQYSYLLYPDRRLPLFTEKNNIPAEKVRDSELLAMLIADEETSIVIRDSIGGLHFHGSFRNAAVLESALESLDKERYGRLVRKEKAMILDVYEEIFDHQSFTGRSGTFYAYEGLGSIYWHMVSKLLLAAQECYLRAIDSGEDAALSERLKEYYYDIKAGIGTQKSPDLYGAFPTDAYSHTPGNSGARQPGMTGQVKEDIISRMGELGVKIEEGRIRFEPSLLRSDEFMTTDDHFKFINVAGNTELILLSQNQLAFTICQVPVIYTLADRQEIEVLTNGNDFLRFPGDALDLNTSSLIFSRSGVIRQLRVSVRLQS